MSKKYDFIFALGPACSCTQAIRTAGLQYGSFPLDWLGLESGFATAVELVRKDFRGWLEAGDLEDRPDKKSPTAHRVVRNRRLDIIIGHDFPLDRSVAEALPEIAAKYERRRARLVSCIRRSRRVLAVCLNPPNYEPVAAGLLRSCREALAAAYPGVSFDVLAFEYARGVSPRERRRETVGEGIVRLAFDYLDHGPLSTRYGANYELVAGVLRDEGIAVRDYRTRAEKKAHRARVDERYMRQLNARPGLDFLLARIEYKLFRHFEKRLRKRGAVLAAGADTEKR